MSLFAQEMIRKLLDLDATNQDGWFLKIVEAPEGQPVNRFLGQIENSVGFREAKERPRDDDAVYERRHSYSVASVGWDSVDPAASGTTSFSVVRNGFTVTDHVAMPCEKYDNTDAYRIVDGYGKELSKECALAHGPFEVLGGHESRWWLTMAMLLGATRNAFGYADRSFPYPKRFSATPTKNCQAEVLMSVSPFSEELPPYPCVTVIRPLFRQMARAIDLLFRTNSSGRVDMPAKGQQASPDVASMSKDDRRKLRDRRIRELFKMHRNHIKHRGNKTGVYNWVIFDQIARKDEILATVGDLPCKEQIAKIAKAKQGGAKGGAAPRQR